MIRQYAANNFDNEKSIRFMRAINDGKISKKKFNFRAVPEEVKLRILKGVLKC